MLMYTVLTLSIDLSETNSYFAGCIKIQYCITQCQYNVSIIKIYLPPPSIYLSIYKNSQRDYPVLPSNGHYYPVRTNFYM